MRNTEPSRVLSQTAEYALRAVLTLARSDGTPVGAERLAAEAGLPPSYLLKTLQTLVAAGIVTSTRGRTGGFRLAVASSELTLMRVVEAFDGRADRAHCLLGRGRCYDRHPCAAHTRWKPASDEIMRFFRMTTVADLAA